MAAVGEEKAEVELLHVDAELQAEIIAAYNSDLQKSGPSRRKKWLVKLQLKR